MKKNFFGMCAVTIFCSVLLTCSGAAAENTRFEVVGDGTVKDAQTGLMWAASDNGASINWSGAIDYCETYSVGGHSDWRMPTTTELATLYGNKKKVDGIDYQSTVDLVTNSIKISAPYVWAARRTSKNRAFTFSFNYGTLRRLKRGTGGNRRALPVRTMP